MIWAFLPAWAGPTAVISDQAMGGQVQIRVRCESGFWLAECQTNGVAARSEIQRIESWATDWRDDSEIGRLNAEGKRALPEEIVNLLTISQAVGGWTYGAFDITIGGMWGLWDFEAHKIPSSAEREAVLRSVGQPVFIEGSSVHLSPGAQVTLGGVAQGYAASEALKRIPERRSALVDVSGDIAVRGSWTIDLQHPRADRGLAFAQLQLHNAALSTSGDYERYFEDDGRRYHHILDPRTGMPGEGAISATVVHKQGAIADALATALIVLGPEESAVLAADAWALVVTPDGEIHELGRRGTHVRSLLVPERLPTKGIHKP